MIGCKVTRAAAWSLPNQVLTAIPWDTETYDTHGFHSVVTGITRFTIPAGQAGYYAVGGVWVSAVLVGTSASRVLARIMLNGVEAWGGETTGGVYNTASAATDLLLAVGDYVEFAAMAPGPCLTSLPNSGFYLRKVGI